MNDVRSKTLITAGELAALLDAQKPVVLLDVIDEPGAAPEDRPKIPGALSVDLATDFSGKPTRCGRPAAVAGYRRTAVESARLGNPQR